VLFFLYAALRESLLADSDSLLHELRYPLGARC
jgi:hypothetical protein